MIFSCCNLYDSQVGLIELLSLEKLKTIIEANLLYNEHRSPNHIHVFLVLHLQNRFLYI